MEGAVRPATVVELARKNGVTLPTEDPSELYRYDSLDSFLDVFWLVQSLLVDADDWERAAYESLIDAAAARPALPRDVLHPGPPSGRRAAPADIVEGLSRGIARAEAETNVRCMLICDMDRAFGPAALELVGEAVDLRREGWATG